MKALAQRGIFYGWAIVLVGFLTMLLVMGTRFSFGVFYSGMLASIAGIWVAAPRTARRAVRAPVSSPAPRTTR